MPTAQSEAIAARPSVADEMAKFSGFTTNNSETVDAKTEDLNPVAGKNISSGERQAGATTVAEAKAAKVASPAAIVKAAVAAAKDGAEPTEATEDEVAETEDDGKVVSLAEAKTMAAQAATKRVGKAVAKQRAAERRADVAEGRTAALEARLLALEQGRAAPAAKTGDLTPEKTSAINGSTAPDPKDFTYGELDSRYIAALARHETRLEIRASQQATEATTATAEQTRAAAEFKTALTAFTAKGEEAYDDFDEVVVQGAKDGVWALSATLGQLLLTSDVGTKVAYELASDPKEAARISALSEARQAAWFGKREAELSPETGVDAKPKPAKVEDQAPAKPAVKLSQAPAPVVRARGSGEKSGVSGDTTDFAAFEALARQRKG